MEEINEERMKGIADITTEIPEEIFGTAVGKNDGGVTPPETDSLSPAMENVPLQPERESYGMNSPVPPDMENVPLQPERESYGMNSPVPPDMGDVPLQPERESYEMNSPVPPVPGNDTTQTALGAGGDYMSKNVSESRKEVRKPEYDPVWETPHNSEKNLAIVVFGLLGAMVAALIILLSFQIQKVSESGVPVKLPFSWEEFAKNPFKQKENASIPKHSGKEETPQNGEESDPKEMQDSVFDRIDWEDSSWKEGHTNYTPEQTGTEYYENIVDCIDTEVAYRLRNDFYEVKDREHKISVRLAYTQLEGDIPNLDKINEVIKEEALSYANYYEEQKDSYNTYVEENGGGYIARVDSYVTYNSEDLVSIVLEESYKNAVGNSYVGLYGININTKTGTIYDNTKLLQINDSFAAEFKKRSRRQNGPVKEGVDDRSPAEIAQFMRREDNLILFYTPLGMEVGYNYYTGGITGWVTVTFKDYAGYGNDL